MLRQMTVAFGMLAATAALQTSAGADIGDQNRARVNQHVIGLMGGVPGSTDLDLAYDMNLAFSDHYDLRVIAICGQGGSARKFEDLMYLRGVDMAVVQHDVVQFMEKNDIFPGIQESVRLIAPLSMDQLHVLAHQDIKSIYDLTGQTVNFGLAESGSAMTASVVFDALGISVNVVNNDHKIALDLLRKGEIAAMVRASAAPISLFKEIEPEERLHLLSVPLAGDLGQTYTPVALSSNDYPALVWPGQPVETVGINMTLISYNWPKGNPRGENLALFAKRFYGEFDKLLGDGFHESWKTIDPTQEVPGLKRHWSAEEAMPLFEGSHRAGFTAQR